jgi:murein DD-endopeptidase MepM/ murein hydrolase activator NlpD
VRPTAGPDVLAALLAEPLQPAPAQPDLIAFDIERDLYNPFTIVPDRPRAEVIAYEVQSGDTIFSIAERFGLNPETIAWSNDRGIILGLQPGRELNILPVDGAYWQVQSEESIQAIADRFRVDPYAIIDSEFNDLFGAMPDTLLPPGVRVVIPGGTGEAIVWTPRVEQRDSASSGGGGGGSQVIFESGDPGSCGWVDNPPSTGGWTNPVPAGYTWTRGFTSFHTGVDLAAPVGQPVVAAMNGVVVFSGWNTYGYGYAIVISAGPYMTLYGHLSADNVNCGQYVNAGQIIGAVGSTGDSSGPHLHFEIRVNGGAVDPTGTMAF